MIVLPGIVLPWTELQYPGGQSTAPMQPATSLSRGKGSLLSSSKKLFFLSARQRERKHCFTIFWCLLRYSEEQLATVVQDVWFSTLLYMIQYIMYVFSWVTVSKVLPDSAAASALSWLRVCGSQTPSSAISLSRGKGEGSSLSSFKKFLFS